MPASSRPVTESWSLCQLTLPTLLDDVERFFTSSPMTAKKFRSLYADGGAAIIGRESYEAVISSLQRDGITWRSPSLQHKAALLGKARG